jgi:hypothetical protein
MLGQIVNGTLTSRATADTRMRAGFPLPPFGVEERDRAWAEVPA